MCAWCSMLRMISERLLMPQTVGTRPTALYGSITSLPPSSSRRPLTKGSLPQRPHHQAHAPTRGRPLALALTSSEQGSFLAPSTPRRVRAHEVVGGEELAA